VTGFFQEIAKAAGGCLRGLEDVITPQAGGSSRHAEKAVSTA